MNKNIQKTARKKNHQISSPYITKSLKNLSTHIFSRMKGLNILSEEILMIIIRNIPHNSLPALGQCSHKFQRLIVPQLYRCVFFDGSNYEHPNSNSLNMFRKWKESLPIYKPSDKCLPPYEPSQIFQLDPFLRSISKSEYLCSLVEVASFGWFNTYRNVPKAIDLLDVTTILSYLLPLLQSVSLSAIAPPATINRFIDLKLTSFALFYDNFGDQSITMRDLYSVFCIQTLRHLILDSVNHLGIRTMSPRSFHSENSVSNLASLSISKIEVQVGNFLRSIIGWPKALEKLDISFHPDHHWWNSIGHPIYPVLRQGKSLKELNISAISEPLFPVRGDFLSYDPAKHRGFHALKRLCIPLEHLIVTSLSMELNSHPEGSDFPRQILYDTIPPGLEELTIECPQEVQDEESQFAHDLSSWQKNIWKYQAYYPNLTNVNFVLRDLEEA